MHGSIWPVTIPPDNPWDKSCLSGPGLGICFKRSCPRGKSQGFSFSLAIMRRRALCSRVGLHDGYEPHCLTSNNVGSCWLTMLRPFVRSLIRRNISQHCCPMLGQQFWEMLRPCWQWCAKGCDNSQQHATACNRVCKRTQHVTSSNVGSCWPTKMRPFAQSLTSILELKQILPWLV